MKARDTGSDRKGFKPTIEELYTWLDTQILCTIATIGHDGYPNAATVAFSQTKELAFLFITDASSRKASNISRDNRVALTVTGDDRYTVQLEGDVRALSWDEFTQYEQYHYKKLPFSLPFKNIPGQTPFLVTPTHIRFSDIGVRPWELTDY